MVFQPTIIGPAGKFDRVILPTRQLPDNLSIPVFIHAKAISIVIPVKNNQAGIDRFLQLLAARTAPDHFPLEVIIVDNNSDVPLKVENHYPFRVILAHCERPGPAAARNEGVSIASGQWILFTDSDCVPTASFVAGYLGVSRAAVALAGAVNTVGDDPLAQYYREQNIFVPMVLTSVNGYEPWAVVTANCLVLKEAFVAVGGFDEKFIYAGGEDTDFGLRLRHVGIIRYNFASLSEHEVKDGLGGFVTRFIRYGIGSKLMAEKYQTDIFDISTVGLKTANPVSKALGLIQLKAMIWGFEGLSFENFPLQKYLNGMTPEVRRALGLQEVRANG